jgi:hypothetical protein
MQTITVKYQVFNFQELNREAKEKAIKDHYEAEEYPFLESDLIESLKALLEQKKVKYDNIKLLYSLSYCQGDGLCFTGNFEYKGKHYKITHSYRYYFSKSVEIEEIKEDENIYLPFQDNKDHPFIKLYLSICKELEKEGYGILEYRMNDKEFAEFCESNDYKFLKTGEPFLEKDK